MLTVFVHPNEADALDWMQNHMHDNSRTRDGEFLNPNKDICYEQTTPSTDGYLQFKGGKWFVSKPYQLLYGGTNTIFILGTVYGNGPHVEWLRNPHI